MRLRRAISQRWLARRPAGRAVRWLFLLAYTCSGFAGLAYQVSWTRLLTLYIGHTTAAASAVVAAFLGGLAAGAAVAGAVAPRTSPRRALQGYAALEIAVALLAAIFPSALSALTPMLRWAYHDAAGGFLFPLVRVLLCLILVFIPAAALGATFPLAVRWFAATSSQPARASGQLYALNTVGAAVGSLLSGFLFIPTIGISGTTLTGIAGSLVAAIIAFSVARSATLEPSNPEPLNRGTLKPSNPGTVQPHNPKTLEPLNRPVVAIVVLGVTGFAGLVHEIAWTRVLALVLGPTIYAFSATLAAVITGVGLGSWLGSSIVGRSTRPASWLAAALIAAASTAAWSYSLAGTEIPRIVALDLAAGVPTFDERLRQGLLLTAVLVLPTSICLGAAFPLGLALAADPAKPIARQVGLVYAVNTVGAVAGSLAAGFVIIPLFGLQITLALVCGSLIVATIFVLVHGALTRRARITGGVAAIGATAVIVFSPPWDRELLASGAYLYAPYVPKDLDLETLLKAGQLLYYREGGAATVSVKRLTGTTTLAVDGKTDASNRGDMLTQKLAAHLPLLLHQRPRDVAIIGLGSGVTAGAALRHPIDRADVIEISSEVVEASRFFELENKRALSDPRTRLIVGDGRSHLLLSQRQYDVIVSEPSNPWIAGVASLFTEEFFRAAKSRLRADGILCQWANAYNISDADLRSIVATFRSVFPEGSAWLIGADDVLLVGTMRPLDHFLANVSSNWRQPGVAEDLAEVGVVEPFGLWSLFVGGPAELRRFAAHASPFSDDRMALEFSAPRELHTRASGENSAALASLFDPASAPAAIKTALASATAGQWRNRAAMMVKRDAHATAYDDYIRALRMAATDRDTLNGFTQTAILLKRGADALSWLKSLTEARPATVDVLVARSKLLSSIGEHADARRAAQQAAALRHPTGVEQLASVAADAGDVGELEQAVALLHTLAPDRPPTLYYEAVLSFLKGNAREAITIAERVVAIDSEYAPVHDLLGAAHLKMGNAANARDAFLRSIELNARDSTAYTNLGLIELAAGNRDAARRYFAESLWLAPESDTAREGLAQSR